MAGRDLASPIEPDDGVDITLIRWMLSLAPEERLAVLQGFIDSVAELTEAPTSGAVQMPLSDFRIM